MLRGLRRRPVKGLALPDVFCRDAGESARVEGDSREGIKAVRSGAPAAGKREEAQKERALKFTQQNTTLIINCQPVFYRYSIRMRFKGDESRRGPQEPTLKNRGWGTHTQNRPTRFRPGHPAGVLTIREGKGKRDRTVPIGERALFCLDQYLSRVRAEMATEPDQEMIFLTSTGVLFTPNHLSWLVRKYIQAANVAKNGACHIFRHTMATLMLEGGADTRYIQEMLGHARLDTTQIYTHVSIRKLKQVHSRTHPAARI